MTTEQRDLSAALVAFLARTDPDGRVVKTPPAPFVARGDGMYAGDDDYYLQVGHAALSPILQSLSAVNRRVSEVSSILDYACGFGRVSRWLKASFPHAKLVCADLDPKAVAAVASILDVETMVLTKDLSRPLPGVFDLIWIGSLFTHLHEDEVASVLRFLSKHLTPNGVIVATTHGPYVVQRMRSGEKNYNLPNDRIAAIARDYDSAGSAFCPYPGLSDYGISVIRAHAMAQLAYKAGFEMVFFKERGWVQHQDCFGLRIAK